MKPNTVAFAILILILGNLCATFSDVLVKWIATPEIVFQYMLCRELILLAVITPLWMRQTQSKRHAGNIKVHCGRAILANVGGATTVVALLYLPLATANVLFYAAPIFTLLLAGLLFNEPLKRHRIIAMGLGFVGIVIAMRPEYINLAGLSALTTALSVAIFNLSVRWLPKTSTTLSTVFWTNLLALPITALMAIATWQPVTQELLVLSVGSCLFLFVYQWSSIVAFQHSDAGAIAISEYSGLIFAAILGWVFFSENLDALTIMGICLIIVPILWQSRAEYRFEKQQRKFEADALAAQNQAHPNFIAQAPLKELASPEHNETKER